MARRRCLQSLVPWSQPRTHHRWTRWHHRPRDDAATQVHRRWSTHFAVRSGAHHVHAGLYAMHAGRHREGYAEEAREPVVCIASMTSRGPTSSLQPRRYASTHSRNNNKKTEQQKTKDDKTHTPLPLRLGIFMIRVPLKVATGVVALSGWGLYIGWRVMVTLFRRVIGKPSATKETGVGPFLGYNEPGSNRELSLPLKILTSISAYPFGFIAELFQKHQQDVVEMVGSLWLHLGHFVIQDDFLMNKYGPLLVVEPGEDLMMSTHAHSGKTIVSITLPLVRVADKRGVGVIVSRFNSAAEDDGPEDQRLINSVHVELEDAGPNGGVLVHDLKVPRTFQVYSEEALRTMMENDQAPPTAAPQRSHEAAEGDNDDLSDTERIVVKQKPGREPVEAVDADAAEFTEKK